MSDLLSPWRLGDRTLRNRVVRSATFEGMSPGGRPSPALVEHHREMARQQVGLTTVAYGAVHPHGRTFGDQLLVDEESEEGLRRVADAVHAEGGAVSLQLAHCGGFSKLVDPRRGPPMGPSAGINAYGVMQGVWRIRAMRETDIATVVEAFAAAAVRAQRCGFDAVEVHCGHGYLISQFLSPVFNRRRDRWGADLEGRMRLAVEVVRAVRRAVGSGFPVLAKLNTRDGVPGGLEIDEAVRVGRALRDVGVDALVPSGGLVQRNAFYLLRGANPLRRMIEVETSTGQRWALRLFGPWVVQAVPFTPTFFWDDACRILDAVDIPVALLGGIDGADDMARARARGFAAVVLGRALLADPDLVVRMRKGERFVTRCTRCNDCVATFDAGGVRCVLDDPV